VGRYSPPRRGGSGSVGPAQPRRPCSRGGGRRWEEVTRLDNFGDALDFYIKAVVVAAFIGGAVVFGVLLFIAKHIRWGT
jgi:hypothetical protein